MEGFEEYEKRARNIEKNVYELEDLRGKAPELFGVPTGTKLDEMFYKIEIENGRAVKKPLGGIPYRGIINVVGVPDTGKSVLAEQFALVQASLGYKVLFVTSETPAEFLYASLKGKSLAMGIDFDEAEKNIIVVDASTSDELRENVFALMKTMDYAIRRKKTTITVIDSITGFYEHKEMLARQIVRKIYSFLKGRNQTALLVSQKRSSQQEMSAEAAGGLAVAHILDGTIVLDKKVILTRFDERLYGLPIGEVIRMIRIDGCRMTGHDTKIHIMRITEFGTIEILEPLSEFIKRVR